MITAGVISDGKMKGPIQAQQRNPGLDQKDGDNQHFQRGRDTAAVGMEGLSKYECKWGTYGFQVGSW